MTVVDLAPSVVGLGGALAVAALAWRRAEWAVALVVLTVPLQGYARIGASSGGITWTQAWLWSFLASAALLWCSGQIRVRIDLVAVLAVAVVACYAVAIHPGMDDRLWANEVYRWSAATAFFLMARSLLVDREPLVPLMVATAIGAAWTGLVAVGQVVGDIGPASFERSGVSRAYASFGEPNPFGAYASASALALGVCALGCRRRRPPAFTAACSLGCATATVGLLLSQSRGAVAATGLVVAGALVVAGLHAGLRWRVVGVVALVAASLLVAPLLVDRLAGSSVSSEVSTGSWANKERAAHWGAAVAMVRETRGVGVGAGQFDRRFRESTPTWRFRIPRGHAHDAYLQVTSEAGLAGGLGYLALILAMVASLALRWGADRGATVVAAALVVTVGFAAHNLVDYLHVLNLPLVVVAWWAAALGQREGSDRSL